MHKTEGAHVQCMNNHYANFEYYGYVMKTFGVTDYTFNQTPSKHFTEKMSKFKTAEDEKKISSNVYKKRGAQLQCMNNHCAKFEYKGMKTVGVTDYTNQTPPMHFSLKKCLCSTPVKNVKIFIKCAQNRRCTSSMYEQSLDKVWI